MLDKRLSPRGQEGTAYASLARVPSSARAASAGSGTERLVGRGCVAGVPSSGATCHLLSIGQGGKSLSWGRGGGGDGGPAMRQSTSICASESLPHPHPALCDAFSPMKEDNVPMGKGNPKSLPVDLCVESKPALSDVVPRQASTKERARVCPSRTAPLAKHQARPSYRKGSLGTTLAAHPRGNTWHVF